MSLIWLNLRSLWKQQRFFFLLLVFIQAVSAFSMLFVVGVIINNQLIEPLNPRDRGMGIGFLEPVTYGEVEEALLDIFEGPLRTAGDEMEVKAHISDENMYKGDYSVWARVRVKNRRYFPGFFYNAIMAAQLETGRAFTEEELNSEDCKAIVLGWPYEEVVINGEVYEVIGSRMNYNEPEYTHVNVLVPPKKLRDLELHVVKFKSLNRFLTVEEEQQLYAILDAAIPGKYTIDEATIVVSEDAKAALRAGILACVLMGIILAGTLSMIYLHVIDKRKYKMAVFRLTGSSAWKSLKLLLGEMLVLAIPSVALGMALFYLAQRSKLEALYPYMQTYLNGEMYAKIFLGLIAFLTVFLFVIAAIKCMVSIKRQLLAAKE